MIYPDTLDLLETNCEESFPLEIYQDGFSSKTSIIEKCFHGLTHTSGLEQCEIILYIYDAYRLRQFDDWLKNTIHRVGAFAVRLVHRGQKSLFMVTIFNDQLVYVPDGTRWTTQLTLNVHSVISEKNSIFSVLDHRGQEKIITLDSTLSDTMRGVPVIEVEEVEVILLPPMPYLTVNDVDVEMLVVDNIPPVITLLGDNVVVLAVGDTYIESGYSAVDATDGDVTVVVTETIDNTIHNSSMITYTATDSSGNTATKYRHVNFKYEPYTRASLIQAISDWAIDPTPLNVNRITYANTSEITDMSNIFKSGGYTTLTATQIERIKDFDLPIDFWDMSKVTNTNAMFHSAALFNQDVSDWDMSGVTNFKAMFYRATSFNQDIGSWDVGSATNMRSMFNTATLFNQNISSWDVGSVTTSLYFNIRSSLEDINNPFT